MSVALAKVESWEDHVEAWHHFGRQVDGAAWGRAATAASVKERFHEKGVREFATAVGFSWQSIYDFAKTFDTFPMASDRSEVLTFTHHLWAAKFAGTADKAKAALGRAAEGTEGKRWSANALRAHLSPPEPEVPAEGTACDTEEGTCGPLTKRDKTAHIAGLVESLHQSMRLFEAVKSYDLDPLVEHGTKKSLKELIKKIDNVSEWLGSLRAAAKRRTQ